MHTTLDLSLMRVFITTYRYVVDSLFPRPRAQAELLSLSPEEALERLPPAPDHSRLAVALPRTWSIFAYKDDRVTQLVRLIKERKDSIALRIGGYAVLSYIERIIAELHLTARSDRPDPSDLDLVAPIVIPIPITPAKRRKRGYNQCELLADDALRLSDGDRFLVEKELLLRTGDASEQKLKDKEERVRSAHGIFAVDEAVLQRRNYPLTASIIVLDDVITTGSTARAAVEVLRGAGFYNIYVLSLAH